MEPSHILAKYSDALYVTDLNIRPRIVKKRNAVVSTTKAKTAEILKIVAYVTNQDIYTLMP